MREVTREDHETKQPGTFECVFGDLEGLSFQWRWSKWSRVVEVVKGSESGRRSSRVVIPSVRDRREREESVRSVYLSILALKKVVLTIEIGENDRPNTLREAHLTVRAKSHGEQRAGRAPDQTFFIVLTFGRDACGASTTPARAFGAKISGAYACACIE